MRQVIVICRSRKKARLHVASVLDRYLWRIGDRTWRGTASNACLQRISADLRKKASRSTAVAVFEIKRTASSRLPLVIIGSKNRFSPNGVAPISEGTSSYFAGRKSERSLQEEVLRSAVRIAALFHDLGKATPMFQNKLRRAMKCPPYAIVDPLRHEVFSAFLFDAFTHNMTDNQLLEKMQAPFEELIELLNASSSNAAKVCFHQIDGRTNAGGAPRRLPLADFGSSRGLAGAIISLILTHHRLTTSPTDVNDLSFDDASYIGPEPYARPTDFQIADDADVPWRCGRWLAALRREAHALQRRLRTNALPAQIFDGLAQYGRTALMLGDHLASALSEPSVGNCDNTILANTKREGCAVGMKIGSPADTLNTHTDRVHNETRRALDALMTRRDQYPGLNVDQAPRGIIAPEPASERFAWQDAAADAAARLSSSSDGGFFACLMAGTGTGKTRAAPRILSAAAFHDVDPDRRRLRYNLGLGLRTLARQSGREYVKDLGFAPQYVATLAGGVTLDWDLDDRGAEARSREQEMTGSEDRTDALAGLLAEHPAVAVPEDGTESPEWLASLSAYFDQGLPAFIDRVIEIDRNADAFRRLIATPILAATIDHFMPAADAQRSRHLPAMIRTLTADLVIDEVDLFEDEDIAAICRLVYTAGVGGRRVVIMSATLQDDVAAALYKSYQTGYAAHARLFGKRDHIHVLVAGDEPSTIQLNENGEEFCGLYRRARDEILARLDTRKALRIGQLVEIKSSWPDICAKISAACEDLHARHAWDLDGRRISFGLIRMTRINHAAALAFNLAKADHDSTDANSKRHRAFICLHARLPIAARSLIETELGDALQRKGAKPNENAIRFLRRHGVLNAAAPDSDISVIVIASPVIETGNDLDFDYAVVDPSSLRAVVQTAGRVNRHRARPIDKANIAVLSRPVHALAHGRLQNPGVETPPAMATGLCRLELDGPRTFEHLFGREILDKIDARGALRESKHGSLTAFERERRRRFLHEMPSINDFISRPLLQFSNRHPVARRFRRQDAPTCDVFPRFERGLQTWYWRSWKSGKIEKLEMGRAEETVPSEAFLLAFDLESLARRAEMSLEQLEASGERLLSVSVRESVLTVSKEARWFSPELGLMIVAWDRIKEPFGPTS